MLTRYPALAMVVVTISVAPLFSSAAHAAERRALLRVTAEVVHSCRVTPTSSGVALSCAAAVRPGVAATGTTVRGADVRIAVAAAATEFSVGNQVAVDERSGCDAGSADANDRVTDIVFDVTL